MRALYFRWTHIWLHPNALFGNCVAAKCIKPCMRERLAPPWDYRRGMKFVFITGGVVSSLGKGLTAASVGALLEQQGLKVGMLKMDPYLNVDPGTMNPCQHGEVYVLEDGAETDLDLGHYERFTHARLTRHNSVTSGKIYEAILRNEREGAYLGKTVQVIPHVTDEIKRRIAVCASEGVDVLIVEIGGVVGDIEGLPYLEALRQLAQEQGRENAVFVHLTLLVHLRVSSELKTKPSQQSVAKLREIGLQPDILICRTEVPMEANVREKLSLFCNVPSEAVVEERDVEISTYELPLYLHRQHLDKLLLSHLQLPCVEKPLSVWEDVNRRLRFPKVTVKIGLIGKYTDLPDAYKSVNEALVHAGIENQCKVEIDAVDAESLETDTDKDRLSGLCGILVPGGFGLRGLEGKLRAVRHAREHNVPFFGICLGMQLAVVEFARNVLGYADACSTETGVPTKHPVIDLMEVQKKVSRKGGTMRLGAEPCVLAPNSRIREVYGTDRISERHRHRYEFNDAYAQAFENAGLRLSGRHERLSIVEAIELPLHPWFIGVQFHPEFQSKPHRPHPLFVDFVKASLAYQKQG